MKGDQMILSIIFTQLPDNLAVTADLIPSVLTKRTR